MAGGMGRRGALPPEVKAEVAKKALRTAWHGQAQKPPSDKDSKSIGKSAAGTASSIFEQTPGSSYTYKPEYQGVAGADDKPHYGIMAQDLEKTPEGATMVEEDETGLKRVDADRLSMANSAAINEILRKLREMRGEHRG
jgi:hypothetical protein